MFVGVPSKLYTLNPQDWRSSKISALLLTSFLINFLAFSLVWLLIAAYVLRGKQSKWLRFLSCFSNQDLHSCSFTYCFTKPLRSLLVSLDLHIGPRLRELCSSASCTAYRLDKCLRKNAAAIGQGVILLLCVSLLTPCLWSCPFKTCLLRLMSNASKQTNR